jgi:hypothetical protein
MGTVSSMMCATKLLLNLAVQSFPLAGRVEVATSTGQLEDDLDKMRKQLVNRDAAAKKYKEGCRTLKERVEQLQQVHDLIF